MKSKWDFKNSEKVAIDRAFNAVCAVTSHHCDWMAAYRYERRERHCATSTKALMVSEFARGMASVPVLPGELARISKGCREAVMLGSLWVMQGFPGTWLPAEIAGFAQVCTDAMSARNARALAAPLGAK